MIKWQKIIILYAIISSGYAMARKPRISDAEYSKMPPLFKLDPYRSCFLESQDIYCNLEIELDSNGTSQLLDVIKEYSAHFTRFDHQKLNRGVCVSRSCAKYIDSATQRPLHERNVKSILQQCLNESLWTEFGLDAYVTKVQHCDRYYELSSPVTNAQWAVAAMLGFILFINIFASFYENSLETNTNGNAFLLAFSMKKNVDRVLIGTGNNDNNFGSILGLRFISTFFVIIVHTGAVATFYVDNTEYVENLFDYAWKSVIINGTALIEFFFICSSFLLGYNYTVSQSTSKFSWWFFLKGLIDRYLRLTPVWILVMAIISTWTPMLGSGPLWNELVEVESANCQQNWWILLLYVGNYVKFTNDLCMPHTWYLAADMQLFILGLILIMLVCRYPQQARLLFATVIIAGISIPAVITYKHKLLPIFLYGPEIRRESFSRNKEFVQLYVPSYGHGFAAAIGLLAGWLQYHIQKNEIDLRQWKLFNWVYTLAIPAILLLVQSGAYFYWDTYEYEPVFAVLYAGASRLTCSLLMAIVILGAINKCGKHMREFLELAPFQCLGRMSYCAYLLHVPVLRQYFGTQTAPILMTDFNLLVNALGCLTATYLLAFLLCVMVEYPVNELRRLIFKSRQDKQVKNE